MTLLTITALFVTAALLVMGITAVSNLLFFPRLRRQPPPASAPLVSILIPARNEAEVIGSTIGSLLAQTYPHFELLLLDDHSEDETAVRAQAAAQGDARFRLLHGRALPPGWLGKNWACHQLSQAAQGDILIFTDADVRWTPEALPALLAALDEQTALLAIWPTQQTHTWGERLIVPLVGFAVLAYLPVLPVHYAPWPAFAAANGQCLVFRRAAYEQMGGHTAVAQTIIEDVTLARRTKAAGLRLRLADANQLLTCRMYRSWPAVRDGFAKNILAGHGDSLPFLLLSALFHWLVFLFPWGWWLLTGSWWALALGLAGVGVRAVTAVFTHQRPQDALLMPLSVLLLSRIAAQAVWWRFHGGPRWKGRQIGTMP